MTGPNDDPPGPSPRVRRARSRRRAVRLCDRLTLGLVAAWIVIALGGVFPPAIDGPPRGSGWLATVSATLFVVLVVRSRLDPVTPLREVPLLMRAGALAGGRWSASNHLVPGVFVVGFLLVAGGGIARYRGFASPAAGLAYFENTLWNTLHGRIGLSSFLGDRSLAASFAPLLAVLALPYALVPRSETLLILQAVAVACCAFPLARLARREIRNPSLAHALVLAQMVYMPARGVARYDFEPALFAAPLLLECVVSLREGRARRAACAWGGAVACHPAVLPAASAIALYVVATRGQRWLGLALVGSALTWGAAAMLLGRALGVTDAWQLVSGVGAWHQENTAPSWGPAAIALVVLAPLCFLPLFAPAHALLALPSLVLAIAAGGNGSGGVAAHLATAAPLLLVAATLGARTLLERDDLRTLVAFYPTVAELERYLAGLLLLTAGAFLGWSPVAEIRLASAEGRVARERMLGTLAPDRSVSTQASLAAHLARRREVVMFPDRLASWIVLDGGRWPGPTMGDLDRARWSERLRSTPGCTLEAEVDGVERFHCGADALRQLASSARGSR